MLDLWMAMFINTAVRSQAMELISRHQDRIPGFHRHRGILVAMNLGGKDR